MTRHFKLSTGSNTGSVAGGAGNDSKGRSSLCERYGPGTDWTLNGKENTPQKASPDNSFCEVSPTAEKLKPLAEEAPQPNAADSARDLAAEFDDVLQAEVARFLERQSLADAARVKELREKNLALERKLQEHKVDVEDKMSDIGDIDLSFPASGTPPRHRTPKAKKNRDLFATDADTAIGAKSLKKIPITPRNAHRFFLACLLGAVKFYDDKVPLNAYYAKCGGVCLREMNRLERFFLKVAGFKLHVDPEKYAEYECSLKGPAKNLGMPSTMPITEGLPSTKLIANNSSPTTSQTTSSTTSPTSSPTTTPTTTPSNQQSVTEHPEDFETIPVPNLHFTGATPKSAETVAITQSGPMVPTSVVPHAASEAPLVHAMHLRVAPGLWVETVPVLQHPELLFCRASVKDRWVACPY